MASTDALHTERTANHNHDHVMAYREGVNLESATCRPGISRTRTAGKALTEAGEDGQKHLILSRKDSKGSPSMQVTVEECETDLSKPEEAGNAERAHGSHESNSRTCSGSIHSNGLQVIPDGKARVRAYSSSMARLAEDLLKGLNIAKESSDARSALALRNGLADPMFPVKSVWSPESEPDSYGFEMQAKYYADEL
ncbi:hypothetical protein TI39_contig319g00006 [Zymoseptoria brevis]|uniref:Uncharacterized protein n=1 Tax=Zymoseptoria brevis TaxID=1047168 RepID=A0A0F4GWT2_9PEZI|nr:hypothetical protein TI39_contig319g00006 [Zymoseptoria brevis]